MEFPKEFLGEWRANVDKEAKHEREEAIANTHYSAK